MMDKEVLTVDFLEKKFFQMKNVLKFCMSKKKDCSPLLELKYTFLDLQTKIKKL